MQTSWNKTDGPRLNRFVGTAAVLTVFAVIETSTACAWNPPVAIDLNTSSGLRADSQLSIAGETGAYGAVWSSTSDARGDFGIRFSRSTDAGVTWSSPVDLTGLNGEANGRFGDNPNVAAGGSTWLAAWDACDASGNMIDTSRNIYLRRSTDAGQNWSLPQLLNSDFADSSVRNFSPVLESDGFGTWTALWESEIQDPSDSLLKRGISMSRSVDGGVNWSAVQRLEAHTSTTVIMNPCVATNNQGLWMAAWEIQGPNSRIRLVRSTNNGQTWSSPVDLNTGGSPEASPVSYIGQPSIATDGEGRWVILLTSNYDAATDTRGTDRILSVHSSDDGLTWSSSTEVNSNDGLIKQNPHVVWDYNRFVAVWRSPRELEMGVSSNGGASWAPIEAPGDQNDTSGAVVSHPRLIPSLSAGRQAAWLRVAPGATGPDLLTSREPRQTSAEKWALY